MRLLGALLLFWAFSALAAAATSGGDPTCAKTQVTLRKGPGSNFGVSWNAAKFMPFLKMEAKSGWVRVQDLDGESHWGRPKDFTNALHCVVVKSTVATLRTEPSTTAAPADLKTLDRFTPLKRLESQGEWMHVEDEAGHQAWIHESTVWKPVKIQSMDF